MPLLRNKFQPYFPDPDSPAVINCKGEYCWPVALGDKIYQQWYQTPCGANLVCDSTFGDFTLGSELVTNGTFATNGDDWFVNGVEIGSTNCGSGDVDAWCYNVDGIGHDGTQSKDDPAYQDGLGLVIQTLYRVEVTVRGRAAGSVYVAIGNGANESQGSPIEESGTYTFDLYFQDVTDRIKFVPSEDFDGTITFVSVKEITYDCWNGNQNTWVITPEEETVCAIEINNVVPVNFVNGTTDYITSGDYYKISITVLDVVSGSFQLYIDDGAGNETNLQAAISSNGVYTYYITASQDGQIGFKPTLNFVGCISSPEVYQLRNDYSGDIIASDGSRYDISPYFEYFEDKVTLNTNIFDLLELDYGCYTIEIFDSCLISGDDLVSNGNFADGSTDWTNNNGSYQYNFSSGWVELVFLPLDDGPNLIVNGDFASAAGWTVPAGWAIAAGKATHTPGNTGALSRTVTTSSPATPPNILTHWYQFVISGWTTGTVTVQLSNSTSSFTYGVNDTITGFFATPPTIGGSVTFSIIPSSNFDGSIDDVALHESTRIWSAFPILLNAVNTDFVDGNYEVIYDILNVSGSAGNIGAAGAIQGQSQNVVYQTTVATHTTTVNNYVPGGQRVSLIGRFRVGNNFYPGRVRIDNVEAHRIEPFDATYTSECINYQFSHTRTNLITAYPDQDALGFVFEDADFKFQFRVESRGLNPYYPREGYNTVGSSGNHRLGYGSLSKIYPFHVGLVSEAAHDAIAACLLMDNLLIGPSESDSIAYVSVIQDYVPAWDETGSYSLATGSFSLNLKEGGTKFNRHL